MARSTIRIEIEGETNWATVYVDPANFRLSVQHPKTSLALRLSPDVARQLASILQAAATTVEKAATSPELA